jgi:hypothetical protein
MVKQKITEIEETLRMQKEEIEQLKKKRRNKSGGMFGLLGRINYG